MKKETAQLALQLLQRVDIKGGEVPAYVEVVNALNEISEKIRAGESFQVRDDGRMFYNDEEVVFKKTTEIQSIKDIDIVKTPMHVNSVS